MIETDRLILRNYKMTDFEDYWKYISNSKIGPMCGWPAYTNKQDAMDRLKLETEKKNQFAIVWKENGQVIGSIELMEPSDEKKDTIKMCKETLEVGYLLSEEFWGKGIMPEALHAIMHYGFVELKLPEILICHMKSNVQSGKVQEKAGFKVIDELENARVWIDGNPTNYIRRKMTREEYFNLK